MSQDVVARCDAGEGMRGARTIAGALVFADLLVGGCGGTGSTSDAGDADEAQRGDGGTSGASAGWMEHDCRMQIPDGLNADDYRCGTLMVDGEGGDELLSIEVAVLEASADTPAPDPLVFVGGGPGSASLDGYLQTHSAAVLSPIREARDIVFFDQRGSGRATPSLECPEVVDATVASLSRDDSPEEEAPRCWTRTRTAASVWKGRVSPSAATTEPPWRVTSTR